MMLTKRRVVISNRSLSFAILSVTTGIALSTLTPSPAAGQEACTLPDMILTVGEVTFIDNNEEGVGPGDNRVLIHYLSDENGEELGFVHAMSTVLHAPEPGAVTMYARGSVHVDGGTLHWTNTSTLEDPADTSRSTDDTFETVVVGGTGAFRHARGIIHLAPLVDNSYDMSFDISCEG